MVTSALPVTVVNEGIEVTLLALANPIAAPPDISKATPDGLPDKVMAEAEIPLQYVWFATAFATGVAFIVTAISVAFCVQLSTDLGQPKYNWYLPKD